MVFHGYPTSYTDRWRVDMLSNMFFLVLYLIVGKQNSIAVTFVSREPFDWTSKDIGRISRTPTLLPDMGCWRLLENATAACQEQKRWKVPDMVSLVLHERLSLYNALAKLPRAVRCSFTGLVMRRSIPNTPLEGLQARTLTLARMRHIYALHMWEAAERYKGSSVVGHVLPSLNSRPLDLLFATNKQPLLQDIYKRLSDHAVIHS